MADMAQRHAISTNFLEGIPKRRKGSIASNTLKMLEILEERLPKGEKEDLLPK